ncbi:MAG: hypothetical protein IPF98_11850 [Gemmatimonadetes bacterium]|nr:hypothetical protein [Gemmatimonadota bacterium]MCC6769599.1 hypothetical protein [Gemmatimonadaceae bacterium]
MKQAPRRRRGAAIVIVRKDADARPPTRAFLTTGVDVMLEEDSRREGEAHAPGTAPGWEGVRELHPAVLRSRLEAGDPLVVIDVREQWEWDAVRLGTAQLMPLGAFARDSESLAHTAEIVVYCHHGARSLAAARYLAERGFTRLWNLSGGIDRYALEGDTTLPRY